MSYIPRCPNCDEELEYTDFYFGEVDGDCAYFDANGYCPKCGRKYKWEEVFEIVEVRNYVQIEEA